MAAITVKVNETQGTFSISDGNKSLTVSLGEVTLPFKEAMEWSRENGGGDETSENIRLLATYREAINAELKAAGHPILEGDYWTNEVDYESPNGYAITIRIDVRHNEMLRVPRMQLRTCKVRAISQI